MLKKTRRRYSGLRKKVPPNLLLKMILYEDMLRDVFVAEYHEGAFRSQEMKGQLLRIQRIGHRDIVDIEYLGHSMKFEGISFFNEGFTTLDGYLEDYVPKPGDVVVDGGAFVGFFTVLAAKLVGPTGKVLSFEPDPANYEMLLRNIKLNDLNNVIPVQAALLDRESTLLLNAGGGEDSALEVYAFSKEHLIEVQVVRLDHEVRRLGIDRVDFIKLDIEGSEGPCLLGSSEILANNEVHLAIASYHLVDGEMTCAQVEMILKGMGYQAWTAYPAHLTTYGNR